jgi:formate-dependent nitrite reductase cytochrome c552 subunit
MARTVREQIVSRRLELGVKLGVLLLFLLFPALVGYGVWREHSYQALGEPVGQPIPFSHKHHVGDDGIDCRYCHTTVETSRHAGLPATSICLTCHSQLFTDASVVKPLHDSARTGQPIAWKRVHTLPDFVFFDHSVHVAKGVACIECHGRVDQMPLMWRAQPLQMQWCLACHANPAPHLHPPSEVFRMPPHSVSAAESQQLTRLLKLESRQRLTDCSTCHR